METRSDDDTPLDDTELERLQDFLRGRAASLGDLDAETDPGVLGLSELDGFLTGVASGPEPIMPSTWLLALWGEVGHEFESEAQFEAVATLMIRHHNARSRVLMGAPAAFEPLFGDAAGASDLGVDEWCSGYARAVSLTVEAWEAGGSTVADMLYPIFLFGLPDGWERLEAMSPDEERRLQGEVAPAARELHAYWQRRRMPAASRGRALRATVGRNAPCPCGSGSKYKHCCLKRAS